MKHWILTSVLMAGTLSGAVLAPLLTAGSSIHIPNSTSLLRVFNAEHPLAMPTQRVVAYDCIQLRLSLDQFAQQPRSKLERFVVATVQVGPIPATESTQSLRANTVVAGQAILEIVLADGIELLEVYDHPLPTENERVSISLGNLRLNALETVVLRVNVGPFRRRTSVAIARLKSRYNPTLQTAPVRVAATRDPSVIAASKNNALDASTMRAIYTSRAHALASQ